MALNAPLAHNTPVAGGKAQVEVPDCIHALLAFLCILSLQLLRIARSSVSQNWLQAFSELSGKG